MLGLTAQSSPRFAVGSLFASAAELAETHAAVERGGVDGREIRLKRADGSEFAALLSGRPLDYDDVPCLVLGIVDVTERETARMQIERQREMIYHREKLGALGGLN